MFNSLRYFLGETCRSLIRNKFMAVASILTVTLSMFILGIFLPVVFNMNHMASYLESQVEMSVYLREGLTTDQVMGVGRRLKALPDLKELSFTNKDQAMEKLKERMKDQPGILNALEGKNPLPSSYELTFTNPEAVKKTAAIVAEYPEVESSHYGQEIIEQLFQITAVVR